MTTSCFYSIRALLLLSALVIMLFAAGCASPNYVWYQQGKDNITSTRDKLVCEEESALYAKHIDKRGNEEVISARMKECMELRGYVQIREEDLPQGANKL